MDVKINVIPDLTNMLIQLVATGILFAIVYYFAYKPVKNNLVKRQNYIEEGIKKAEEARIAATEINEKYEGKMQEAKVKSSEIISNAKKYGDDIKRRAIEESKDLAKIEYEKGLKDLENEKQKAIKSLSEEIADMAIYAAEKVLRERVDSEIDKKMVKSFIKDLEKDYE